MRPRYDSLQSTIEQITPVEINVLYLHQLCRVYTTKPPQLYPCCSCCARKIWRENKNPHHICWFPFLSFLHLCACVYLVDVVAFTILWLHVSFFFEGDWLSPNLIKTNSSCFVVPSAAEEWNLRIKKKSIDNLLWMIYLKLVFQKNHFSLLVWAFGLKWVQLR